LGGQKLKNGPRDHDHIYYGVVYHPKAKTYIECDWNTEFAAVNLEVEGMWNIIKNKIDDGVKRFVPLT